MAEIGPRITSRLRRLEAQGFPILAVTPRASDVAERLAKVAVNK